MSDEKFIAFFQQCIERLREKTLTKSQEQLVLEFYTNFLFSDAVNVSALSESELLRYLSLGWFIYNEIGNNRLKD